MSLLPAAGLPKKSLGDEELDEEEITEDMRQGQGADLPKPKV